VTGFDRVWVRTGWVVSQSELTRTVRRQVYGLCRHHERI